MEGTCAVRFTRRYQASLEEVWAALTDPGSIARWLGSAEQLELRPGGPFSVRLSTAERMEGRVREADPPRLLELDWNRVGESPSVLRLELRHDGDVTELVLDHRLIAASIGMRYLTVWERVLARLDEELRR